MKLKLLDYRVVTLNFEATDTGSSCESSHGGLDLRVGNFFPDDSENIFGVGFKVSLRQEGYSVKTEMRFFFETDSPVDDDFKKSSFPSVNAPAIAFPYLRSFLSVVTMQAGYPPVMLPSINFVEFAKQHQKSE